MTLKEFLQDKTLTAVELINYNSDQIINVYVEGACYGLNIDTSNIPCGTSLEYRTDFTLDGDILSVSDFSINTNDVEMLGL
jgi:hypothetical protein